MNEQDSSIDSSQSETNNISRKKLEQKNMEKSLKDKDYKAINDKLNEFLGEFSKEVGDSVQNHESIEEETM